MGEIADTMTKKKKKGRPSLLDLQKRAIKQQQLQQQQQHHKDDEDEDEDHHHRSASKNPNSPNHIRSKRRNPNLNGDDEAEEDDDERREKKHRLLHGLNSQSLRHSSNSLSDGSDLNLDDRRRIIGGGSDYTREKNSKATDIPQGSFVESGPTCSTTTPLPDKKLLLFILDRLQKKDTYGVYSDPVDPEELPDYHEIITNPMDFNTVRKKLDSRAYATLEQFESDVFLICANAMEYNSADTVYYRQARAIQELAKKDFENLRRESDDEEPQNQQPKVARRGRPPKKHPDPSLIDHTASEISSDTLIPGGDSSNRLFGAYNLRKTPPSYKSRQAEPAVRINHNSETQSLWSVDWENEFPSSVVKAVNKYGLKHFNVDENRRDTYNHLSTSTQEPSVLTTLEDELKQLIPVGLNTEYGYARSLARYAANLGPIAWKTASRRIETVLPSGVKFGLGWVGENLEGPEGDTSQKRILLMSSGKQKCSNDLASDDHSNRILSPTASVSSAFVGNRHCSSAQEIEETTPPPPARGLNPETTYPSSSSSRLAGSLINPESSHNPSRMLGVARQQQLNEPNEAIQGSQQQGVLFPSKKQEPERFPPDLNAMLVSTNSPGSNPQTGCSSTSQHPDLALQL